MFNFTPLSGAQSQSSASQSLLELDGGVKLLLDVGWDEEFNVEQLRNLEKHVPTLSVILLTHATVSHLAAYAHCCKHFPLFTRIPIYATTPVISLGRTLLQDLYASTPLSNTFIPEASLSEAAFSFSQPKSASESRILLPPPTHEEIASYLALIHPLKYSQPHQPLPSPFSPPLNGLTITAYNAGHTLGGTIWHIQHGLESIVYAVDWNQARENTLAGAAWLGGSGAGGTEVIEQLRKPTALICSSRGAERVALAGGRNKRDEQLLNMIKATVSKGGTVLIPTDSSARVIELAYLLEHFWRKEAADRSKPFELGGIFLASRNIGATMKYVRSMLEFMDESIVRELEQSGAQEGKQGDGPFDFKHVRLLERRAQIDKILNQDDGKAFGKVILASDTSLEWGFSKDILRKIAGDSRNLVILTERLGLLEGERSGIARTFWSWWDERRDDVSVEHVDGGDSVEFVLSGGRELIVTDAKKVALEGTELASYQQWLATQRQLQTTLQQGGATSLEAADVVDDASSESSSDSEGSEPDQQGKALNISTALGQASKKKIGLSDEDLGVNILLRRKGVYDYDVRGKKGRESMFPMVIRKKRTDDFGDLIRPENYLRAEERDEIDGEDMRQIGKFDTQPTLGKKRQWDDGGDRKMLNGGNKRQRIDVDLVQDKIDSILAANEAVEAEDLDLVEDDIEEIILGPSKVSLTSETLVVNLKLAFIDFTGLHDKRSLQMLIPLIKPRKLILVSGTKEETTFLANECRRLLGAANSENDKSADIFTPHIGMTVDASVDTNAWAVKLTESLVKRLRWQQVKGMGVVTLSGRLAAPGAESQPPDAEGSNKKQKLLKDESEGPTSTRASNEIAPTVAAMPTLDIVPTSMASATRSVAQPLHVGDLRLADLKKLMAAAGFAAEFRGEGTLLIDGSVAVRKTATGKIEVESVGGMSMPNGYSIQQRGVFHAVKTKIYEGLAVVAGGG